MHLWPKQEKVRFRVLNGPPNPNSSPFKVDKINCELYCIKGELHYVKGVLLPLRTSHIALKVI